jgi:2-dehydro-3-deoxyphosphogluconate aldolase / (4S)-4-hydroxy-2-oxoglutarate aldolase
MMTPAELLECGPVIPVIVVESIDAAVPMARALCAGGIRVLEVTLRTAPAMDSVRAIAAAVPEAIVGVGTVVEPGQFRLARDAGARFAVTPGLTRELAEEAKAVGLPLLPGVMTPSEVIAALAAGFRELKFFPAQQAGGVGMLKALHGPFPQVRFCPTGGITAETAASFLSLPNVRCVGGSWLTPRKLLEQKDWPAVTALAKTASQFARA